MTGELREGWCPSLFKPMQSGDGWLLRVKPKAGKLSAEQARIIAAQASRYGNGHIDLTARANLQVRGMEPKGAARFAAAAVPAGIAHAVAAIERVRNVTTSPLGPNDPSAPLNSHALAAIAEEALTTAQPLEAIPSKFGILVDGGGLFSLAGFSADIILRPASRSPGSAVAISLDGGKQAVTCGTSDLAVVLGHLVQAFLALNAEQAEPASRMRGLVEACGEEAVFARAGLSPQRAPREPKIAPSPIGFTPVPQERRGVFGIGLPFGRIETDALHSLADLCSRFGDGRLRLTPWRVLMISGVLASDRHALAEAASRLRLITDPNDPRLSIYTCVGAPTCRKASVHARRDAARLAEHLSLQAAERRPGANGATHPRLHVSGCPKACAHPQAAEITLTGRDGRYDLIWHGKAGDAPNRTNLDIEDVIAALDEELAS